MLYVSDCAASLSLPVTGAPTDVPTALFSGTVRLYGSPVQYGGSLDCTT